MKLTQLRCGYWDAGMLKLEKSWWNECVHENWDVASTNSNMRGSCLKMVLSCATKIKLEWGEVTAYNLMGNMSLDLNGKKGFMWPNSK